MPAVSISMHMHMPHAHAPCTCTCAPWLSLSLSLEMRAPCMLVRMCMCTCTLSLYKIILIGSCNMLPIYVAHKSINAVPIHVRTKGISCTEVHIACTRTRTCTVRLYENAPYQRMHQFILPYQFMWKSTGMSCILHAHMPRHENMSTRILTARAEANANTYCMHGPCHKP